MHSLSSIAVLVLAAAPLAAQQDLNTTQLDRFDEHLAYNDVWGYSAPDGREYALLGVTNGLSIVNVTDPLATYEVAFFPDVNCIWRDIKTWDRFVYDVTDCSAGVRVFDMLDPEQPVFVGQFGTSVAANTHNVQIDTQTGLLYLTGTNNGMRLFDLAANPVAPPLVGSWFGPYVHDVFVRDGLAHAALIYNGDYRILDVSNPGNIQMVGNVDSGALFTHATWITEDGNLAVVADETANPRHLVFFDITDKSDPILLSRYTENKISIPHNPFIRDDVCHISWYTEGYIALDISDPAFPVKIGRFDTSPNIDPGGTNGFEGAWGVYPFTESGFVYVSDRKRGLFVLSLNRCSGELPPSAVPQICDVWPSAVASLSTPRQRMILTGSGFLGATSVNVGGWTLGPSDFEVLTDQTIAFRLPPLVAVGDNPITVGNGNGVSAAVEIDVALPADVILDTGEPTAAAGSAVLMAMASEPGNIHYATLSFSDAPSVLPNVVSFGIGNGFTDLYFLPATVANAAGTSALLLPIPVTAVGVTVYWQFAYIDPQVGTPASVSDVTSTAFVSQL